MAKVRLWILGRFPLNRCFPKAFFFWGGDLWKCVYDGSYFCMVPFLFLVFYWSRCGFRSGFCHPILLWDDCHRRFFPWEVFSPEGNSLGFKVAGVHSSTDDNRFRFCTSMWRVVSSFENQYLQKTQLSFVGLSTCFRQFPSKESSSNEGRPISVWEGSFTHGTGSKVKEIPNSVHILVSSLEIQTFDPEIRNVKHGFILGKIDDFYRPKN